VNYLENKLILELRDRFFSCVRPLDQRYVILPKSSVRAACAALSLTALDRNMNGLQFWKKEWSYLSLEKCKLKVLFLCTVLQLVTVFTEKKIWTFIISFIQILKELSGYCIFLFF
jgi:hypothetical protein